MIDFIKSLPKPILIGSCIAIYILIGMLVSFIAGLFDDGNEDFIAIGALWIFVLPLAALMGVVWIFVAPFKFGAKISKPKVSNIPPITDDELGEYYDELGEYVESVSCSERQTKGIVAYDELGEYYEEEENE